MPDNNDRPFPYSAVKAIQRSDALILLNGDKVSLSALPFALSEYDCVLCADGAWNEVVDLGMQSAVSQIIGDGDSILQPDNNKWQADADQSTTDFEKALKYLNQCGICSADVYWGSGASMDHFLGNLSVAARYHNDIQCVFYDQHQYYFFVNSDLGMTCRPEQTVTLYPFPTATVSSQGLLYPLQDTKLDLCCKQSLRNKTTAYRLTLNVSGQIWIFVSH